jgi:hypothetical protein
LKGFTNGVKIFVADFAFVDPQKSSQVFCGPRRRIQSTTHLRGNVARKITGYKQREVDVLL